MKLLIAAATFVVTLGVLFLIEADGLPKDNYTAQVIEALEQEREGNTGNETGSYPTPRLITGRTPTFIPTLTAQPSAPAETRIITPSAFATPVPPPATLTPTPASAATPSHTPSPTPKPASEQIPESKKININTAGYEELQEITGVGPVIGQRIIDYRNANGPFQKIEDIKNVKGIGDITFEKMKDEITI